MAGSATPDEKLFFCREGVHQSLECRIPKALTDSDGLDGWNLSDIRNRLDGLEMQAYGLKIKKVFGDNPWILEIAITNTDDLDDNGRHIGLEVVEFDEEASDEDYEGAENLMDELRDELNETLRSRSLYDYIDEIMRLKVLKRGVLDSQLGEAYDAIFSQGNWKELQALREAAALEGQTPERTGRRQPGRA